MRLVRVCTACMGCDEIYHYVILNKSFVRFSETHVGSTSTNDKSLVENQTLD